MLAIANECMHVSVGDPKVRALLIGTGVAFGEYALGCSSPTFHLTPRTNRSRCRPSSRRRREGQTTGRAIIWGAGLEETVEYAALGPTGWGGRPKREPVQTPEPRRREEQADHEQEYEHMKGHTKPRS
jgi:hypothetical protein